VNTVIENIPDEDEVHRLIDFPSMYDLNSNLIWQNVFQFPDGQPESVSWGKYASSADAIHDLGSAWEAKKKQKKPDMRYIGFISSIARDIRGITTQPGHGFSLSHAPEEGHHHAEISYKPNGSMSRAQKNELKVALRNVFGPLVSRTQAAK
jgi:hypothetical protein